MPGQNKRIVHALLIQWTAFSIQEDVKQMGKI